MAKSRKKISEEEFTRHLEEVSDEVATWPEWKQTLLGGTAKKPTALQLRKKADKLRMEAAELDIQAASMDGRFIQPVGGCANCGCDDCKAMRQHADSDEV